MMTLATGCSSHTFPGYIPLIAGPSPPRNSVTVLNPSQVAGGCPVEALHFTPIHNLIGSVGHPFAPTQGEMQQLNIRLPFALAKLTQQDDFEMFKRLLRVVVSINCGEDILQDQLGQLGKRVCIFEFLGPYACHGELHLDEAETDCWFLLIIGAQFDRGRGRHSEVTNLVKHGEALCEGRCSSGDEGQVVPAS
jgi:hypothetical protein